MFSRRHRSACSGGGGRGEAGQGRGRSRDVAGLLGLGGSLLAANFIPRPDLALSYRSAWQREQASSLFTLLFPVHSAAQGPQENCFVRFASSPESQHCHQFPCELFESGVHSSLPSRVWFVRVRHPMLLQLCCRCQIPN